MNRQEIFDRVATHLLTQGGKSWLVRYSSGGGECAYRGEKGLKCAAGILIPDELYTADMEGVAIPPTGCMPASDTLLGGRTRTVMDALKAGGVEEAEWSFVRALQQLHDGKDPWLWQHSLRNLAIEFGLSSDVVNALPPIPCTKEQP